MKPIRLIAGFFTVGLWTLLSRVLGFAREVIIMSLIGPGPLMDAFIAAFRLPNMFRRFFAEGAFNAAFVPMFSKKLESGENEKEFAQNAFNGLFLAVFILTALGMAFMPAMIWATADGFSDDGRFDLSIQFGRIAFPYILCMSLAALLSGLLNATGRFAVAAAAPVILNVIMITALTIGALTDRANVAWWLIWAVPIAGVAQLFATWFAASKAGFTLLPGRPRWTPDMRDMVMIALPAALASGVMQINLLVGQRVASQFDNAVSWLFAADRLYQLPLGVVGIAVGVVLLPDLSRRLRSGDKDGARDGLSRAGEIALALTIPSAVALVVIPTTLVSILYERGASGPDDTAAIALAVMVYGLGLPAFVLQKIVQPMYFAHEDTKRPFHFAIAAMVINAAVAVGLAPYLGWIAPALATTLAGWAMFVMLAIGARKYGTLAKFDERFHRRIWRIIGASLAMGAVLWGANALMQPILGTPYWRIPGLIVLLAIGAVTYFGVGGKIGAFKMGELKSALRRG